MNPIGGKIIQRATAASLFSMETLYRQVEQVTLNSDGHPDDDLLLAYLDAAIDHAERFTGRAILVKTYEVALDEFPRTRTPALYLTPAERLPIGIELPFPPLIEILRFAYGDDSDSELEPVEQYTVDTYGDKAVLRPVTAWPTTVTASPNVITCRYRAGYSGEVEPDSDLEPLPGGIKAAILLTVGHLYANREATIEGAIAELPLGVEALLRPHRVLTGMA